MRLTNEQWLAIRKAERDGNLSTLIADMLYEARQDGIDDVLDDPQAYDLVSSDRGGN